MKLNWLKQSWAFRMVPQQSSKAALKKVSVNGVGSKWTVRAMDGYVPSPNRIDRWQRARRT